MTDKKALEETLRLSDTASAILLRAGKGSLELTAKQGRDALAEVPDALHYADALTFRVGASVNETLGVVDALARFVNKEIVHVGSPRALMKDPHVAAIDEALVEADRESRRVLADSDEVTTLNDHTADSAVVFAELVSLDEGAWTGFQEAVVNVIAEIDDHENDGRIALLVDLGSSLAVADQIPSLTRFRGAMLWFRE